ncbi:MAG TPA: lipopolysaccharide assembly protein LapA domain-containing protein [Beijerinckiaceae bacterium]|jgi:hypothetical protein
MRTFLKTLILLPVAVVVVLLAVANRGPVTLSFDPFSRAAPEAGLTLTVPLFALIFAAVMLGVVIGGVGAWLAQAKHRRAERRYRREVHHLRSDADRLRSRSDATALATLPSANRSAF